MNYQSFSQLKKLKSLKKYSDDIWKMDYHYFDSFMTCLNNLQPSINYAYEKTKVTRDQKEIQFKFQISLLSMLYSVKMKFLQTCIIKIETLRITELIQNSARKTYLET